MAQRRLWLLKRYNMRQVFKRRKQNGINDNNNNNSSTISTVQISCTACLSRNRKNQRKWPTSKSSSIDRGQARRLRQYPPTLVFHRPVNITLEHKLALLVSLHRTCPCHRSHLNINSPAIRNLRNSHIKHTLVP